LQYVHAKCGFPWGFLLLVLFGLCGCAGCAAISKRRARAQGPFAQQTGYIQAPGVFRV